METPKIKLPKPLNFEGLERLRQQMNAPLITTPVGDNRGDFPKSPWTKVGRQEGEEEPVNLVDVIVLKDGTLGYAEKRVLIYIKEPRSYHGNHNLPKFHFANCHTYQTMKKNGRKERYVASIRLDGKFSIIFQDSSKQDECTLEVCHNCLGHIKYKGYPHNKDEIFKNFTVKEYFEAYPQDFITGSDKPKYKSDNAPRDEYPPNWNEIAQNIKDSVGWKCEECSIDLSSRENRRFLHVHHMDGKRNHNHRSNLKALCVGCHAEQAYHAGHMKNKEYYKAFIQKFGQRDLFS